MKHVPTKKDLHELLLEHVYKGPIINNAHRGDLVEMAVLAALGPPWKYVGLGWHPWDLQRGCGKDRVRIQVKNCARLQLWGETTSPRVQFGWKAKPPAYFKQCYPNKEIENEGWFCEIFVIGYHCNKNRSTADQVDPEQWKYLIIPVCELKPKQSSLSLDKAKTCWPPVKWAGIRAAVDNAIKRNRRKAK